MTSVRGLAPPERRAGQRLKPSGARGPVSTRSTVPPAMPSTSVIYLDVPINHSQLQLGVHATYPVDR